MGALVSFKHRQFYPLKRNGWGAVPLYAHGGLLHPRGPKMNSVCIVI